jgi:hypothetical protein
MAKAELTDTRVQGRPRLTDAGKPETIDLRDGHTAKEAETKHTGGLHEERRTGHDLTEAAREATRRMRAEQGLPPKIKDPAVLSRIATLLEPNVD